MQRFGRSSHPGRRSKLRSRLPREIIPGRPKSSVLSPIFSQQTTGSWYAHSKDDKLWLDRLTLRKADGEITTLNLDEFSVVEVEIIKPRPVAAVIPRTTPTCKEDRDPPLYGVGSGGGTAANKSFKSET